MVPREPRSHGRALSRYSLFWEYEMRLSPYVMFPVSESMKNRSDRPAGIVSLVTGFCVTVGIAYLHMISLGNF